MRLQHELILLSVPYSDIMIQKVQGQCAVSIWMHIGKHKKKKDIWGTCMVCTKFSK